MFSEYALRKMASLMQTAVKTATSQKFRPAPPKDLVKKIVGFLNERVSDFNFFYISEFLAIENFLMGGF